MDDLVFKKYQMAIMFFMLLLIRTSADYNIEREGETRVREGECVFVE